MYANNSPALLKPQGISGYSTRIYRQTDEDHTDFNAPASYKVLVMLGAKSRTSGIILSKVKDGIVFSLTRMAASSGLTDIN